MGSKSTPAPTQMYQPAAAPTAGQSLQEQINLQPQLLEARQKYDPQFNALDFQQLQQYLPQLNDLVSAEQARMSPNQYALNEDLAKQALEGSKADLPSLMKQSALDTFRSEIGSNVGSPIGAEYTSRNLAQLGEQYRNNYQNMGLSLLNKFPTQTQSPNLQGSQGLSAQNLNSAYGNNVGAYGAYQSALANSYYQPAPRSGMNMGGVLGGLGAAAGMGLGAAFAAPTGGMSMLGGAALGGAIGGGAGMGLGSIWG
jgi:hypothetical protein